jgi:hypothetical protein
MKKHLNHLQKDNEGFEKQTGGAAGDHLGTMREDQGQSQSPKEGTAES